MEARERQGHAGKERAACVRACVGTGAGTGQDWDIATCCLAALAAAACPLQRRVPHRTCVPRVCTCTPMTNNNDCCMTTTHVLTQPSTPRMGTKILRLAASMTG